MQGRERKKQRRWESERYAHGKHAARHTDLHFLATHERPVPAQRTRVALGNNVPSSFKNVLEVEVGHRIRAAGHLEDLRSACALLVRGSVAAAPLVARALVRCCSSSSLAACGHTQA